MWTQELLQLQINKKFWEGLIRLLSLHKSKAKAVLLHAMKALGGVEV
jgi:hypothetical protein